MDINEILSHDANFLYQLLSRMAGDCEYFLDHGNRQEKHLWALNVSEHIRIMKEIWSSFPDDQKPEWITYEDIERYEREMQ